MALQGHLEIVQDNGFISGWCWDPEDLNRRVRLQVLVDNEVVGCTTAETFRADLETAGIGDGAHAFSFLLPWPVISSKSLSTIRVSDAATGHPVGGSITFRRTALVPLEQRLLEIEHGMRLLEARFAEADGKAKRDANLTRSMLGTIGAFFTQLSEMPEDVIAARNTFGMSGLLANAYEQYEAFSLAVPQAPGLTVCVSGDGSLADVYGCLRSIQMSGLDAEAEIVLLDEGASAELALVPPLVQNLRYWRLPARHSVIEARNRVAELGARDLLIFLSPSVRVTPNWLAEVRAALAARPDCAVLASRVTRSDGTVQSSALLPDRTGRLADFAYAERPELPALNRLTPAAGVPDTAAVIRGRVFEALGRFDPGFLDGAASMTEFCLRCWDAGYSVLYQPRCVLEWSEGGGLGSFGGASKDPGIATLLANRWDAAPRLAWPRPVGHALLLDDADTATPEDILANALVIQRAGYEVSFGNVAGLSEEPSCGAELRDLGVVVLQAPFDPSVAAAIKNAQPAFAVIEVTTRAAATLAPETIRAISPASRLILRLDETDGYRLAAAEINPEAERLRAAIQSSDGVVTPSAGLAATLSMDHGNPKGPVVISLSPKGAESRRGLWLLLDGTPEALSDSQQWLTTLVPAIAKALPGCPIHAVKRAGITLPKGVKHHAADAAGVSLLRDLRLALAPFRRPAAEPAALSACLAAGLPVIATAAGLDNAAALPGVAIVAATAQAVTRLLRKLDGDDAAWAELAAPLRGSARDEGAAAYRGLVASL